MTDAQHANHRYYYIFLKNKQMRDGHSGFPSVAQIEISHMRTNTLLNFRAISWDPAPSGVHVVFRHGDLFRHEGQHEHGYRRHDGQGQ